MFLSTGSAGPKEEENQKAESTIHSNEISLSKD
jgi:hypothetical protein